MRCCICGKEIDGFGNNPYPLCGKEDTDSRCCDECNSVYVINARLAASRFVSRQPKLNDTVVIFYAKDSDLPIKTLIDNNRYLAGIAYDTDEPIPEGCYKGSWGSFLLNDKTDTYMIYEE